MLEINSKDFIKKNIFIEKSSDYSLSEGQYIVGNDTVKYAVVNLFLKETPELKDLADEIRAEHGYTESCDSYWFFIGLNDLAEAPTDNGITFFPTDEDLIDEGENYTIPVNAKVISDLYDRISDECMNVYGRSPDELLQFSFDRMEHDEDELSI